MIEAIKEQLNKTYPSLISALTASHILLAEAGLLRDAEKEDIVFTEWNVEGEYDLISSVEYNFSILGEPRDRALVTIEHVKDEWKITAIEPL